MNGRVKNQKYKIRENKKMRGTVSGVHLNRKRKLSGGYYYTNNSQNFPKIKGCEFPDFKVQ